MRLNVGNRGNRAAPARTGLTWLIMISLGAALVGGVSRALSGPEAMAITAVFWLAAVIAAFLVGLYFFAFYIVPLSSDEAWSEGFSLLQDYFFERLRGARNVPAELSPSFGEIGAGLVDSHLALSIGRGTEFIRATQPGYVRLLDQEHVADVVDLRLQKRKRIVQAITRDGIPLLIPLSVTFQVRQAENAVDEDIPYPIDSDAIFRLTYSGSVGDEEALLPWHERIIGKVAADLVAEISLHDLEQLYQVQETSTINVIRERLEYNFREQFQEAFAYQGVEDCPIGHLSVSIGNLETPPDVNEQRVRDWQAWWECRIMEERADGETQILLDTQENRRRAQMEVTANLLEGLEEIRRASKENNTELREMVRLHIIETLEKVMASDDGHTQMSEHMLHALGTALDWLQLPED